MKMKNRKIYGNSLQGRKKKFRRKKLTQFEKDCQILAKLIREGRELEAKAPSTEGFNIKKIRETEKAGFKWFIKTRNFLIDLFGENFRDVKAFEKCFHVYEIGNYLGMYRGEIIFVREDLGKAIGILEGIYNSFVNKDIKRRSKVMIHLSKIYHETKDWVAILSRGVK